MSRSTLGVALALGVLSCGTPTPIVADNHPDPLQAEVAELREQVQRLQNQVEHLQAEVAAASTEDELTEMTIDEVMWADERFGSIGDGTEPRLLCHVREWRGFGKMLRFTEKADQNFLLESEGRPPIQAHTGTGGICNDDGSIRYVILTLTEDPAPGVSYRLRPQNRREVYLWAVENGVVAVGK